MLALFLNHPPMFVTGEIALCLSLALFVGALIAAIVRRASEISQLREAGYSKYDDCSSVSGRNGLRSSECSAPRYWQRRRWFDQGRDPRCAKKAPTFEATRS